MLKKLLLFGNSKKLFGKQIFDCDKKLRILCADGSSTMIDNASGFATLVKKKKKESPYVIVTHYFIQKYALATKTFAIRLKEVLSRAINGINKIRCRSLNLFILKDLFPKNGRRILRSTLPHRSSVASKTSLALMV